MGEGKNLSRVPIELAGHAWVWRRAVALQAERIQSAPTVADRFVDGYLLVIAVRQVYASALAMNKGVLGTDRILRSAIEDFLIDHPAAKHVRDILIHFDEYEIGNGSLQKEGKMGRLDIRLERNDATTIWLVLADGVRIELSSAADAALQLADQVLSAPDRFVVRAD